MATTDNNQNTFESKTILTSPGGNIEASQTIAGSNLTFTHPSGSNIQFGNATTSSFNSGNEQKLTLSHSFNTTYGDNCNFTGGTNENRIEGDSVRFTGPTSLISEKVMDRWYDAYFEGYGALKTQWPDNRFDFSPNDYPLNTCYSAPAGLSSITVCPPLIDGTMDDNLNKESQNEYDKKMMSKEAINDSEATKNLQTKLNQTYTDFDSNIESLYNSKYGTNYTDLEEIV